MDSKLERRHSRWYEVILFNVFFQFILSYVVVVLLPNWLRWGDNLFFWLHYTSSVQYSTFVINSIAFLVSFFILRRLKLFPGTRSLPYIIPTVVLSWTVVFSISSLVHHAPYARSVLFGSFALAIMVALVGHYLDQRYKTLKLAIVPFARALDLVDTDKAYATVLEKPDLENRRFDAVVADLHDTELPPTWQQFLANCTLARIPVFHIQQVNESLTGRVQINHLSENVLGSLQPSTIYTALKRFIDFLSVFILLPLLIPIMLLTALAIKLDSKGNIFYTQKRIGYRGKTFTMYKFRSMRNDIHGKGFTSEGEDPRITRVGKVIRKYRIDELPQVLNVLKGEMSFIGPRPESQNLAEWYEKEVPFFSYRHIVRPGLSGWAQTNQGYAAEVDGMNVKLEYDFYYIKHFSLWLDILIVVKTIQTIVTGFGAR